MTSTRNKWENQQITKKFKNKHRRFYTSLYQHKIRKIFKRLRQLNRCDFEHFDSITTRNYKWNSDTEKYEYDGIIKRKTLSQQERKKKSRNTNLQFSFKEKKTMEQQKPAPITFTYPTNYLYEINKPIVLSIIGDFKIYISKKIYFFIQTNKHKIKTDDSSLLIKRIIRNKMFKSLIYLLVLSTGTNTTVFDIIHQQFREKNISEEIAKKIILKINQLKLYFNTHTRYHGILESEQIEFLKLNLFVDCLFKTYSKQSFIVRDLIPKDIMLLIFKYYCDETMSENSLHYNSNTKVFVQYKYDPLPSKSLRIEAKYFPIFTYSQRLCCIVAKQAMNGRIKVQCITPSPYVSFGLIHESNYSEVLDFIHGKSCDAWNKTTGNWLFDIDKKSIEIGCGSTLSGDDFNWERKKKKKDSLFWSYYGNHENKIISFKHCIQSSNFDYYYYAKHELRMYERNNEIVGSSFQEFDRFIQNDSNEVKPQDEKYFFAMCFSTHENYQPKYQILS